MLCGYKRDLGSTDDPLALAVRVMGIGIIELLVLSVLRPMVGVPGTRTEGAQLICRLGQEFEHEPGLKVVSAYRGGVHA
jgi:hypothetical protein